MLLSSTTTDENAGRTAMPSRYLPMLCCILRLTVSVVVLSENHRDEPFRSPHVGAVRFAQRVKQSAFLYANAISVSQNCGAQDDGHADPVAQGQCQASIENCGRGVGRMPHPTIGAALD